MDVLEVPLGLIRHQHMVSRRSPARCSGFHRIRHYGLFANGERAENLAGVRYLLAVPTPQHELRNADTNADELPAHALHARAAVAA
ncbi:hypothetical protein FHP25_05140 [Vineibacter terrae]|uniref:Uncharacterized protein n=1 Tax=Vineibacter terrae TaxID=2586908 RepID=A0A5C8PSX6_9HYPH|nr:hypothetical protein [Vineibacter terrae]TXL80416.1 hypothetical protein FHP25_05140 [Vineibacter terrae]